MSMYPLHVYRNTTMLFLSIYTDILYRSVIVEQNHPHLRKNRDYRNKSFR